MQFYWGVEAQLAPKETNSDDMVRSAIATSAESGKIDSGDLVVVTAGVPSGTAGTTNMIRVHVVGCVLLAGNGVGKKAATGRVCNTTKAGWQDRFTDGDVLVIGTMEADMAAYTKRAGAIISLEDGFTSGAAIVGMNYGIPVVLGVDGRMLDDGVVVTVDGARGKVFEGQANAR